MANVIGLSQEHEDNLRKLADYLIKGELKAEFDMRQYSEGHYCGPSRQLDCGTAGCAAGHGPYAGVAKKRGEGWEEYILRAFGIPDTDNYYYSWCFDAEWAECDNTSSGAGKRILYLLDHGLPDNAKEQTQKKAPLCYL